jgi:hypothetical protein
MALKPITDAIKDPVSNLSNAAQSGATNLKNKLDATDQATALAPVTGGSNNRLETASSAKGQPTAKTAYDTFFELDNWNENPLSAVMQPTYNIRLFMVEDTPLIMDQYASYQDFCDAIGKKQQTTIAATGVSDINIVSLTMESIPGLNKQTRSMQSTKMTMVLKEPMGVSFMDMMAETARELRIRNFAKGYYMLEVSFMGYEEGGRYTVNPCDGEKYASNKGKWLYQVAILNIDTKMDSTGGEYTLTMIPYQQQMYDDNNLTLPENVNVLGTTVVDTLNNVAKSMNEAVLFSYGFQAREYQFKFYDLKMGSKTVTMNEFKVTPTKEEFGHRRNNSMDQATSTSIKAHFAQGTAINDVVELVFANSTAAQLLLLDVTTQDELTKAQVEKKEMRKSVLFKVEVTADFASPNEEDQYDYANENYIMKYTLHVLPYFTQTPILTHNDVKVSQDTQVQIKNARMLRENGYLSKKYDYLFTGLNTEVLNLDIKFNMNWQASLPRILGTGTSVESNAVADKKDKPPKEKMDDQREVMRKNQEIYRRRQDKKEKAEADVAALKKLEGDPNKPKDLAAQIKKAEDARDAVIADTAEEEKAKEALKARNAAQEILDKERKAFQNAQNALRPRKRSDDERGGSHQFAEDILEYPMEDKRNTVAVSTVQVSQDARYITQGAIADQNTSDRSVYGAVLNQLYGGLAFQMASIKMDIKGDPYWLGATNTERAFLLAKRPPFYQVRLLETESVDLDRPNYERGEVMFIVQFKYPSGFDGETGSPVMKTNDYFTGAYVVKRIIHRFEGGQFKQSVEAMRAPLIDVFKAFGYRDPVEEKEKKEAAEKAAAEKKAAEEKKAQEKK